MDALGKTALRAPLKLLVTRCSKRRFLSQGESEDRTTCLGVLRPQTAAVRLNDHPGKCQSDPQARRFGRKERLEDFFELIIPYPRPGVANRDL